MSSNRKFPQGPDGVESTQDKVRVIVARTCRQPAVRDDQSLARDLNLDKDDRVELLMAVELAFRIDFSESEAEVIDTVEDLIGLVRWKTRSIGLPSGNDEPAGTEGAKRTTVRSRRH